MYQGKSIENGKIHKRGKKGNKKLFQIYAQKTVKKHVNASLLLLLCLSNQHIYIIFGNVKKKKTPQKNDSRSLVRNTTVCYVLRKKRTIIFSLN